MVFRSSAIPPFTGTAPPQTPLPPPKGTSAICRSTAKRTSAATCSTEAGQATASGGCGARPALVQSSARGQQSRDEAHRSAGSQEAVTPIWAMSRCSALPRAVALGSGPVTRALRPPRRALRS